MSSADRSEAAARHIPVAHQRDASGDRRDKTGAEPRHNSETRLQAAVVRQAAASDRDPYADVPCTD